MKGGYCTAIAVLLHKVNKQSMDSLGLVVLPCWTLLTVTVPKDDPKMVVSPADNVWNKADLPAAAAELSELVKATVFSTTADPDVT